jgi:phage shock protein A
MQRALDKTEQMRARADAVQELEAAGTFEDLTALGPGEDDIDRQLRELSSGSEVDQELARMKAELGAGSGGAAGQLGAGDAAATGGGAAGGAAGAGGASGPAQRPEATEG